MAATSEFIDAEETSIEIHNETLMNCVQNYIAAFIINRVAITESCSKSVTPGRK